MKDTTSIKKNYRILNLPADTGDSIGQHKHLRKHLLPIPCLSSLLGQN